MPDPVRAGLLERKLFKPDPSDEAELRAASEGIDAGRSVTLTEAELVEWEASATGALPDSVEARAAALRCSDSRG